MFIPRHRDVQSIQKLMGQFPVTAILGARQCGKTTLARQFSAPSYFDLENPRDLAQLENPQLALEPLRGLIVIDEIQRAPELFPLLRHLADSHPDQTYLILGSASRDLIRQSNESLAGRIGYHYLGGLSLENVGFHQLNSHWLRGGFPRSFLASDDSASAIWRQNFVTSFLERDIPQLGITIPAPTLRRFWTTLSHYHGQLLNCAELARSFGVSDMTVRRYIDILTGTFMVRLLQPWHTNLGKRLVRSPRLYLRDSGIFHSLQSIGTRDELLSHNKLGASWEGFALECTDRAIGRGEEDLYFWRTHSGAEVDLFWQHGGKSWAVECKYADAPRLSRSMRSALADLELEHLWVVYPGDQAYRLDERVTVLPLRDLEQVAERAGAPIQ